MKCRVVNIPTCNNRQKLSDLGERWEEVKDMYSRVNLLFGDVVKVTPSSKVVGDMALFMVQNDLDEESVLARGKTIDFPESVIEFFEGYIGQPYGGFPKELQKVILKEREAITVRPGELLEDVDFEQLSNELNDKLGTSCYKSRSTFVCTLSESV